MQLRPRRAGSDVLDLQIFSDASEDGTDPLANVVVDPIKDRHGRSILTVRDQNTFAEQLRQKRLMDLIHLWLIHRFKAEIVYYVTPTEDNIYQTEKMKIARHLQRRLPGGRRDHRRRREPAADRRTARARPEGAAPVDQQAGLSRRVTGIHVLRRKCECTTAKRGFLWWV